MHSLLFYVPFLYNFVVTLHYKERSHMTNDNYNPFDQIFQDLGIKVLNIEHIKYDGYKSIILHAIPLNDNDAIICCPECGSTSIKKHGYHTRNIKHIKMFNYDTTIKLKQCRFICKDCRKTFNEKCDTVDKYSHVSKQLKLDILYSCRTKKSFKDVSKDLNISSATVMNTFNENVYVERRNLTRVICIDEFSADTDAGKYALSIGDPVGCEILDVLPSRKQEYIYYYFKNLDDEERKNVKYIITDLFESYRTVIRNLFFKSTHIADRYHWIRLSTNAFNMVRIRIMKSFIKRCDETRDIDERRELSLYASLMKGYYKIFLANRYRQEASYYAEETKKEIYGKYLTRQDIIETVINSDNELENAYWLLQDLYKISIYSSYESFDQDIKDWFEKVYEYNIKEFKKVMYTYKEWLKEIRNSFIIDDKTHKRLTNGFIEGKNNICKVIKRNAFGFKSFEHMRNKILYISTNKLYIKN